MNTVEQLVDEYYRFLRQKTLVSDLGSSKWTEICTPFMGAFNDTIDIYIKSGTEGKIILSDDGQTIRNLELNGIEISRSQNRRDLLDRILQNYGVILDNGNELTLEATEASFPQKKFNLMSAIAEANDLYVLAKHTVTSIFREDVREYLDEQELIYTPYFISKGSTGLEFTFDFQIAYQKKELLLKAFNSVNKMNLPQFLFTWDDVRQIRERQTQKQVIGLAVINNAERDVKDEYLDALVAKGSEFILWSDRNKPENKRKLAA